MENSNYRRKLQIGTQQYEYFDINILKDNNLATIDNLPFSIRVLVENLLRKLDDRVVNEKDLLAIANWQPHYDSLIEIPHHPARVLVQDFTGVPAVVDLAAMRDAAKEQGMDPSKINPLVPVDLVVDHSIQIDYSGTPDSLVQNVKMEYARNNERYALLKWAQRSFDNFKVVPPNSGICHQINLEYLGSVAITDKTNLIYPDSLVGLDSHTTMINGIGVLGWGVGGIEAEAVMLGQPYYMSIPEVVGVKISGELAEGITATDLVLTITELLRGNNVVEKFVEFFGPGVDNLPIPDRATISNMAPEYGATIGFFPIDDKTIDYLRLTNRNQKADITEAYAKRNKFFRSGDEEITYSQIIELDIATVTPSLSGPSKPHDKILLPEMEHHFNKSLPQETKAVEKYSSETNGKTFTLQNGSIVVAAITSCTNTSNPHVLMGAGLLAKKAVELGLTVPNHVKTSFAPGSKVVRDYLNRAELTPHLEALGFHLAAFGCTTCIGNSGPLQKEIEELIEKHDLNVASILSGNRNFEARIHQKIKSNFLASPMLVIAFALSGNIDTDLTSSPIGHSPNGDPVFLRNLWPTNAEIDALVAEHVQSSGYERVYADIFKGDDFWQSLTANKSTTFAWDSASTYIKKPDYFDNFTPEHTKPGDLKNLRPLLLLGDTVTTDHISPAGSIPKEYPAGKYLTDHSVGEEDYNSYGSRRGNHEVMMRGTFGNIRIKNKMVSPKEGSFTIKHPQKTEMFVYDAAMEYKKEGTGLIVIGGKEYGTGSSRDWAAKGSNLLGVKVVLTKSFERIHRNNLVGMGVLPLVFREGESLEGFDITGDEIFTIRGLNNLSPQQEITVHVIRLDGSEFEFKTRSRLDTEIDVAYFEHGGILPYVLRKLINN